MVGWSEFKNGISVSTIKSITSLTNAKVKAVRALEMRKTRRETGLFVAEGAALLLTAKDAGHIPATLLYHGDADLPPATRDYVTAMVDAGVEVLAVSRAILAKLSGKDNPQSILGVFEQIWGGVPEAAGVGASDVWLALEDVRDPGNLGTIIRTVDAVGAKGIMLVGNCCDPFQRECVRATMGSIFAVPLVRMSPETYLQICQDWRGDIAGLHLQASEDFRKVALQRPLLVTMGSEGPGLSKELTAACTKRLFIPMAGKLDSLNLAVATALVLYEVRREALSI